jgi:hypothetical protein
LVIGAWVLALIFLLGSGHLFKFLQFRYFSEDNQDIACPDDTLMGGIEPGFSGGLFDRHNDNAHVVSDATDLQAHADQSGAFLNHHLLHLEPYVSSFGRKFNEIDYGWLEHGMGHPDSADRVVILNPAVAG